MPTDVEIARQHTPRPITEIAAQLGLQPDDLLLYGPTKAKVRLEVLERPRSRPEPGKLILVSAITPTPAGEGKTTTTIGLGQAFARLGESVALALREPSLGPCMGVKGGATGGGWSQIMPASDINLHFTGDFHAVTAANNLLAALLDNHVYHDMEPQLDPRRIEWKRVMDMNDRALRDCIIGLGGPTWGVPRETGFDITAASEIMAILALAEGPADLRRRIDRILVGFTRDGAPVTARCLKGTGAMVALLRDALLPNLVQSLEGVPTFVHAGPFANIAHGCNSVLATRMALHTADWAITEAGFGFDLGAEKFFDIKCRSAGLDTAAVVLVATIRALKMHGGKRSKAELAEPDPAAVRAGLPNLDKHIENIQQFCEPPVVAINRFADDTDEEIAVVREHCARLGVPFAVSDHFAKGGQGAIELARQVMEHAEKKAEPFCPLYCSEDSVEDKVRKVAQKMYGAQGVVFTKTAERDLQDIRRLGYGELPICIAKTQSSLSDDPRLRGRPEHFEVTVRSIRINAGAGFLVVLTGDIMRMPGLPKEPQAWQVDLLPDGEVEGLM
jgi:formate--tetrahydrofolate ligase